MTTGMPKLSSIGCTPCTMVAAAPKPGFFLPFLTLLALATNVGLIACANHSPNYFPAQVGQKWDMVADGTGDITHFEIVGAPTPDHTDPINIHITKTQARAYWQNYTPGAELWWGMHALQDGRWVADYTI